MKNENFKVSVERAWGGWSGYIVKVKTFVGNVGEVEFEAGQNKNWDFDKAQEVADAFRDLTNAKD